MPKKWEKPKMIVLVRGKPEENTLSACKWSSGIQEVGPVLGQVPTCFWGDCMSGESGAASGIVIS